MIHLGYLGWPESYTHDFWCDFLLLMHVNECSNEWISYECSDEDTQTQIIRNSSTRSHASEGENRTRNRSKLQVQTGLIKDSTLWSNGVGLALCTQWPISGNDERFELQTKQNTLHTEIANVNEPCVSVWFCYKFAVSSVMTHRRELIWIQIFNWL
jgi:hypothetical protein